MPLSNGQRICNGHKRDGSACGMVAVHGTAKCKKHGGNSLSGLAHPNYRSGRFSKHLPPQLAARYEEARANPRLLSLSDDIALAEARLAQLLDQASTGESGATWQALQETTDAFRLAQAAGNVEAMQTHWTTMERLIERGVGDVGIWSEIRTVWESRGKLIQTETKTLLGLQQLITVQQHMLMLGAVTDAVVKAVQAHADPPSGRKILMEVEAAFTTLANLEAK